MRLDDGDIRRIKTQDEAAKCLDDFAAELSGTKSGYTYRTSAADGDDSRPDIRAKKARKAEADYAQLSALQQLLSDPMYAQAHSDARDNIAEFKKRMAERLETLENKIECIDEKLETLAPGSAEHKRLMRERETYQRKQQDLLDYYNETIRPIEDRIDDPDNPPSKDELDEFNDRVKGDMDRLFKTDLTTATEKSFDARPETDIKLPTLG